MNYISVTETAKKWGISQKRVQVLCRGRRIDGVMRVGNVWIIPDDAQKPTDARIKNGKYVGVNVKNRSKCAFCTVETKILI
ncbi:hypothetical protein SDC9_162400 [bioreactor metagenome]|uniref:Helix-turn-helix domain-containing protein n=1 Tax=bioreactor metagenome TaxID=1076179 RepID=A0A645FL02_9ZZZZ|nr:DNA-binding protein [Candidatus Metalachnospira sp.]